jgi:outer membrane receptor protein involved in Fe transport
VSSSATSIKLLGALIGAFLATLPQPARAGCDEEADLDKEKIQALMSMSLEDLLQSDTALATGGVKVASDVAPANIVTINRQEILAHGWQSVGEVLQQVPGLYVIDDLVGTSVSVRGVSGGLHAGSRILKVMINGVEVNFRPDLAAFLGPEYIPIEAIERVEVARGPLSAIYGANAFLAIVNVVTREAKFPCAEVSARGGVRTATPSSYYGSGGGSVYLAGKTEFFSALIAARYDVIDRSGLSLRPTFAGQNTPLIQSLFFTQSSENDRAYPAGIFGQLIGEHSKVGKFTLQGGFQQLDSGGEFQLNTVLTHQSRYSLQNFWSNLRHERDWTDWLSSTLEIGYSTGAPAKDEKLFLTGAVDSSYRRNFGYRAWNMKGSLLWKPIEKLQVLGGVDGSIDLEKALFYTQTFLTDADGHQVGETRDLDTSTQSELNPRLTDVGTFLQVTSQPITDLQVTANGRLDFSNLFPVQSSWRLGAAYKINSKIVAKLIAGRAFQAPSPVLLYGLSGLPIQNSVVNVKGSTTVGQTQLVPQIVTSAEAVASILPNEHVSIIASMFWQSVERRIGFLNHGVTYVPINDKEAATAIGGELNVRLSFERFEPYLRATAQTNLWGAQNPAELSPSFWMLGGLHFKLPEAKLMADASVRWVGARGAATSNVAFNDVTYTLPQYVSADLAISSEDLNLFGQRRPTRITLVVNNLFNSSWSEPAFGGFDMPSLGRSGMLQIRQSF